MPASKTELRRVSVRAHDETLRCEVRRPGWWSWFCTEHGWGPGYATRDAARLAKTSHELRHQAAREAERAVALAGKREHEGTHERP